MKRIGILQNPIQEYAWGSRTVIAELLGNPSPSARPQAELWMGAHPKAPSQVMMDGRWEKLGDVIAANPEEVLGKEALSRFGPRLPYLFKVLAAAQPLSIQAHPNQLQAERGFDREEKANIPLDAPERNYRDAYHKPECLCALTPFWALKGFRKVEVIAARMQACCPESLPAENKKLARAPDARGLKQFFESLMMLPSIRRKKSIREAVDAAREGRVDAASCRWIETLHQYYPDDIGVLAPLYLNLVVLEPGQALFLLPGELHSYLEGAAVELMADSDNVLRGGLTHKHVDVPELLTILSFKQRPVSILAPKKKNEYEVVYPVGADEFVLSAICLPYNGVYHSRQRRGVETLLCLEGEGKITDIGSGEQFEVRKGVSFLVPAVVVRYSIEGNLTIYKASVPYL